MREAIIMPAGRPPKYKTPEEMQEVIDAYFRKGGDEGDSGGAWMQFGDAEVFAPTISGLAFALGMSRQALCDYEKKDEFLDTIKRAKSRVEIALEQKLYGNAVTGTIFNLKNNFGWKDKQEQELSGPGGKELPSSVVISVVSPNSNT